jgi:hypothetical protein
MCWLVACSSVWLHLMVQCLLLTTSIEDSVITSVVGSPISVPFHCTLRLLCPSTKHKGSPFAVAAVGAGFNLCDFVFSHKETTVYSESRYINTV